MMKTDIRTYDLVWIVGGIVKETILRQAPYGVCGWKKKIIQNTTHRSGLLQVRLNK